MPQSRYSSEVPHRTPEYYPEDREDYGTAVEVSDPEPEREIPDQETPFRCHYCEKNIGRSGYCDECLDELELENQEVRPLSVWDTNQLEEDKS
jgi:hypothetical protein